MTAAEHQGELDQTADELYALRPDAFASARDEQVRTARAAGQKVLARELGRLRRPTQSAWLINLLWRERRDQMEQLLQLGGELSRAQAQASGPELQRLTGRRRELETALLRAARELGEQAEVSLTATMEREVQATLAAALARSDVAEEVRTGRLLKPAAYAGFGTPPPPTAAAAPIDAPAGASATDLPLTTPDVEEQPAREQSQAREQRSGQPREDAQRTGQQPHTEQQRSEERREAEQRSLERREFEQRSLERREFEERRARERREEALQRARLARDGLTRAAEAVAQRERAAESAQQHSLAIRHQVEQLRERLRDLEVELAAAERAATTAADASRQAQTAHDAAQRALQAAEQSLAAAG